VSVIETFALGLLLSSGAGAGGGPALVIEPGSDQYPAGAAEQALQGDVPVTLSVAPNGEFRCSVAADASLGTLRQASCGLIAQRNVFGPRVADGEAQPTTYNFIVRWRLKASTKQFGGAIPINRPDWITYADYPAIAKRNMLTGKVAVAFDINERGLAENCTVTKTNATSTLSGFVCPLLMSRAMFLPAVGDDDNLRRTSGTFSTDWRWCQSSRWQSCPSPDTGK